LDSLEFSPLVQSIRQLKAGLMGQDGLELRVADQIVEFGGWMSRLEWDGDSAGLPNADKGGGKFS
jgi:hypothetical protein